MKTMFLGLIRVYWFTVPTHKRRRCLFRESCSQFVYRETLAMGFVKGLAALRTRLYQCRPGYKLVKNQAANTFEMHLENGIVIDEKHISEKLLPPFSYNYEIM